MPIAFRHRNDPAPVLPELPGLAVREERDAAEMARLQLRHESEMRARLADANRAYVALLDGVRVAWGWVASSVATIGALRATFALGEGERYLWNCVTLAAHRGRGIFPRLLNEMVAIESTDGERFWIAYAPVNSACGAGIRKAGFIVVAELVTSIESHTFNAGGSPC